MFPNHLFYDQIRSTFKYFSKMTFPYLLPLQSLNVCFVARVTSTNGTLRQNFKHSRFCTTLAIFLNFAREDLIISAKTYYTEANKVTLQHILYD